MILWVDAQLSPALAPWLRQAFPVEAYSLRDLALRDARDREIFAAAREAGAIVLTKDSDFPEIVRRLGPPPQVLWLTCGNTSNERLRGLLMAALPAALSLLTQGSALVEITDAR